jgi:hypothetical protein
MLIEEVEFGEYYCAEPVDGTAGGGEDAGVCQARDPVAV